MSSKLPVTVGNSINADNVTGFSVFFKNNFAFFSSKVCLHITCLFFFKMKFLRIYANNSNSPLRIDPEDLHPGSRIKMIITRDHKKHMRLNIEKNVLRSLVASYRHNILILKGDTTTDELLLELSRDCVSLETNLPRNPMLTKLCKSLASVISSWPRMWIGMNKIVSGHITEWYSTSSICVIQFAKKPKMVTSQYRQHFLSKAFLKLALGIFSHILNKIVEKEEIVKILSMTDRDEQMENKLFLELCDATLSQSHTFRDEMKDISNIIPFMLNEEDDIKQRSSTWPIERNMQNYIKHDDLSSYSVMRDIANIYNKLPTLHQIFQSFDGKETKEQKLLATHFIDHGFNISEWKHQALKNVIPLVFPTDWVIKASDHKDLDLPMFVLTRDL